MKARFLSVVKKKYDTATTAMIQKWPNAVNTTVRRISGSRFCLERFTAHIITADCMSIMTQYVTASFQEKIRYLPNLPIE